MLNGYISAGRNTLYGLPFTSVTTKERGVLQESSDAALEARVSAHQEVSQEIRWGLGEGLKRAVPHPHSPVSLELN